jgi:glyoxalase family protein
MPLEGLHHITAITADAPRNVDFYARLLGLRLVKKTVNFDAPDVYHLYFGDEEGTPGSILTFFEFPGAARGRTGAGMVHTIRWRVGGEASLDFWAARLGDAGFASDRDGGALRFADFEGLRHELLAGDAGDPPLAAHAPDIPAEHALLGFHGIRAYAAQPERSAGLLEALGFVRSGRDAGEGAGEWRLGGDARHALLAWEPPPLERGRTSAGTVHHVAWSAADDDELLEYRARAVAAGAHARTSSTASTSTRSTSASRTGCCSSWPRATSASPTTSRSRRSARRSSCRRSSRGTARSSSGA